MSAEEEYAELGNGGVVVEVTPVLDPPHPATSDLGSFLQANNSQPFSPVSPVVTETSQADELASSLPLTRSGIRKLSQIPDEVTSDSGTESLRGSLIMGSTTHSKAEDETGPLEPSASVPRRQRKVIIEEPVAEPPQRPPAEEPQLSDAGEVAEGTVMLGPSFQEQSSQRSTREMIYQMKRQRVYDSVADEKGVANALSRFQTTHPKGMNPRVLLVCDHAFRFTMYHSLLRRIGCQVDTTMDLREGARLAAPSHRLPDHATYSMVLIEKTYKTSPDMSIPDFCFYVRASDLAYQRSSNFVTRTFIVAVVGQQENPRAMMARGVDVCLRRPLLNHMDDIRTILLPATLHSYQRVLLHRTVPNFAQIKALLAPPPQAPKLNEHLEVKVMKVSYGELEDEVKYLKDVQRVNTTEMKKQRDLVATLKSKLAMQEAAEKEKIDILSTELAEGKKESERLYEAVFTLRANLQQARENTKGKVKDDGGAQAMMDELMERLEAEKARQSVLQQTVSTLRQATVNIVKDASTKAKSRRSSGSKIEKDSQMDIAERVMTAMNAAKTVDVEEKETQCDLISEADLKRLEKMKEDEDEMPNRPLKHTVSKAPTARRRKSRHASMSQEQPEVVEEDTPLVQFDRRQTLDVSKTQEFGEMENSLSEGIERKESTMSMEDHIRLLPKKSTRRSSKVPESDPALTSRLKSQVKLLEGSNRALQEAYTKLQMEHDEVQFELSKTEAMVDNIKFDKSIYIAQKEAVENELIRVKSQTFDLDGEKKKMEYAVDNLGDELINLRREAANQKEIIGRLEKKIKTQRMQRLILQAAFADQTQSLRLKQSEVKNLIENPPPSAPKPSASTESQTEGVYVLLDASKDEVIQKLQKKVTDMTSLYEQASAVVAPLEKHVREFRATTEEKVRIAKECEEKLEKVTREAEKWKDNAHGLETMLMARKVEIDGLTMKVKQLKMAKGGGGGGGGGGGAEEPASPRSAGATPPPDYMGTMSEFMLSEVDAIALRKKVAALEESDAAMRRQVRTYKLELDELNGFTPSEAAMEERAGGRLHFFSKSEGSDDTYMCLRDNLLEHLEKFCVAAGIPKPVLGAKHTLASFFTAVDRAITHAKKLVGSRLAIQESIDCQTDFSLLPGEDIGVRQIAVRELSRTGSRARERIGTPVKGSVTEIPDLAPVSAAHIKSLPQSADVLLFDTVEVSTQTDAKDPAFPRTDSKRSSTLLRKHSQHSLGSTPASPMPESIEPGAAADVGSEFTDTFGGTHEERKLKKIAEGMGHDTECQTEFELIDTTAIEAEGQSHVPKVMAAGVLLHQSIWPMYKQLRASVLHDVKPMGFHPTMTMKQVIECMHHDREMLIHVTEKLKHYKPGGGAQPSAAAPPAAAAGGAGAPPGLVVEEPVEAEQPKARRNMRDRRSMVNQRRPLGPPQTPPSEEVSPSGTLTTAANLLGADTAAPEAGARTPGNTALTPSPGHLPPIGRPPLNPLQKLGNNRGGGGGNNQNLNGGLGLLGAGNPQQGHQQSQPSGSPFMQKSPFGQGGRGGGLAAKSKGPTMKTFGFGGRR